MTDQELIWICFEPVVFPYPKILYGSSDPNGDKDIFVPYVPADRIEELVKERDENDALAGKYMDLTDVLKAKLAEAVEALREIAGRHIPSQPATDGGDEIDWCHRQYASLRGIARAKLAELEKRND